MSELVFKRQCGRCPAVEEVPVSYEDIKSGKDPSKDRSRVLKISVGGKTIVDHDFLCDNCLEIVDNYVQNIGRRLEKRSSTRERTVEVSIEE